MNREEVKRLSHEAGMFGGVPEMEGATISERIERFASLVAAAERERCASILEGADQDYLSAYEAAEFIRALD